MKSFRTLLPFLVALLVSAEESLALELPAREIISPGANQWDGEVLEITKGRGATIGWYIEAREATEVTVSIEYTCTELVDQEYHVSFDSHIRFWEVPVTEGGSWSRAELGKFKRVRVCRFWFS